MRIEISSRILLHSLIWAIDTRSFHMLFLLRFLLIRSILSLMLFSRELSDRIRVLLQWWTSTSISILNATRLLSEESVLQRLLDRRESLFVSQRSMHTSRTLTSTASTETLILRSDMMMSFSLILSRMHSWKQLRRVRITIRISSTNLKWWKREAIWAWRWIFLFSYVFFFCFLNLLKCDSFDQLHSLILLIFHDSVVLLSILFLFLLFSFWKRWLIVNVREQHSYESDRYVVRNSMHCTISTKQDSFASMTRSIHMRTRR